MQVMDAPRRQVSPRQLAWLDRETREWQEAGLIDPGVRAALVARYTAVSSARLGMVALILVAVGMCAVGVLLLIGYNWNVIPRAAKLTLVVGAVASAFGASAAASAKARPLVAETLAFFGALLFGNAIWLVAQILHIERRYPDAFLWWAGGVLVSAWLVRSPWIGALGSVLVLVWVGAEGDLAAAPSLQFLLLWPLALAVAYSLRSPLMIRLVAPAAGLWVFFGGMDNSHSALWLGSIALAGCAMYSVGRWHEADSRTRRAWEASGLIVLLIVFIPLMITDVHRQMAPGGGNWLATTIALVAAVAAGASSVRPSRSSADDGVLATASGGRGVDAGIVVGSVGFDARIRTEQHCPVQRAGAGAGGLAHPDGALDGPRCRSGGGRAVCRHLPRRSMDERHREPVVVGAAAGRRRSGAPRDRAALARPGPRAREAIMTRLDVSAPVRAIAAGAVCLAILGGMIVGHAWPLWTGRDVLIAAAVPTTHSSLSGEYVRLSTPADVLMVGAPVGGTDARGTTVRPIDPWLRANPTATPSQQDRRWRGRSVYVQLAGQANGECVPVSVSLRPVAGATNLRGLVTRGLFSGELHVQYGIDAFYMQEGRAQLVETAAREHRRIQIAVAVARSGRARIRRLLVDGVPVR